MMSFAWFKKQSLTLTFLLIILQGRNSQAFFIDDADSIGVEAVQSEATKSYDVSSFGEEETNPRIRRQFVSVTGLGQFPGFPPGWPFGIEQKPPTPGTNPTLPVKSEPCRTIRGEEGHCKLMEKCYPVLYSAEPGNDTETQMTSVILRNPGLAEILRSQVSGPCDPPGEISNQFLFRADAEFRRKLICCPIETENVPLPKPTTTPKPITTTLAMVPTLPHFPPQQHRPFGHRPPTEAPGQGKSTRSPIVASSCGISKIVGGAETVPGKYPWIVALMNGHKQFCGGSLIDNQHVLTAAHCVSHMRAHDVARVRVLLGAHNIHQQSSRTVVKKVARLVRHRLFSHQTLHNDVAVLKLDTPVKFSDHIAPICLTRGQNRFANSEAVVAGWGSVSEHGGQPATLREVKIDVWPNEKCRAKYGHMAPGGITEHMMCAGSYSRDACRGDSGGPLMSHTGSYFEQIGIVSWGIGCGRFPGVYSRVTDFLAWITKNIQ